MKTLTLTAVALTLLMTQQADAKRLGNGGHHVVCTFAGTNSPNEDWTTDTADDADTIYVINLCNSQGGVATIWPNIMI